MEKRAQYQSQLNTSPDRFDADFSIVVKNNRMFVTGDMHLACSKLCATIEPKPGGGYKVALPIGFQTLRDTPPKTVETMGSISELLYWDPVRHQEMLLPGTDSEPVPVPDVLVRREIKDLRMGEAAYIASSYIHPTSDGAWVVQPGPIRYEPVDLTYDMTVTAQIKRVTDGMEVCTPATQPLGITQTNDGTHVVSLTHSC
jgi:hypothetical protein